MSGKIRKKTEDFDHLAKTLNLTSNQSSRRSQKALVRKPKMFSSFLRSILDRCQIQTRDYWLRGAITSSVPYAVPLINKNSNLSASRYNTAITAEKESHLRWRRWESLTEPETKTISRRSMSLIWPTMSLDLVMSTLARTFFTFSLSTTPRRGMKLKKFSPLSILSSHPALVMLFLPWLSSRFGAEFEGNIALVERITDRFNKTLDSNDDRWHSKCN